MDNNKLNEVKDVNWQSVDMEQSRIKFTNNRKKFKIKIAIYGIVIILIAAVSGGISGAYIVRRYYSKIYNPMNKSLSESKNDGNKINYVTNETENPITKVAEKIGSAVVGISNKDNGFAESQDVGSGSGIIFDSNGYIVTNNHVIQGASKVIVKLSSGRILNASIIGTDDRSDLAVIKIDAKNLPILKFGDSSKVKVGELAIAVGNSSGDGSSGSVTAGIVSALNRKVQYGGSVYKIIQTDADIDPGSSGGPLCDGAGEVIGINGLKIDSDQNTDGIRFAIPINEVKDIVKSLMNYGKVSRPSIGIYGQSVISEKNNITGVYVREVIPGSGAVSAGIKPTDIIIELDKKKVVKFEDLSDVLDKHKVGDLVTCKILRNGKIIQTNITLSEIKDKNK